MSLALTRGDLNAEQLNDGMLRLVSRMELSCGAA